MERYISSVAPRSEENLLRRSQDLLLSIHRAPHLLSANQSARRRSLAHLLMPNYSVAEGVIFHFPKLSNIVHSLNS